MGRMPPPPLGGRDQAGLNWSANEELGLPLEAPETPCTSELSLGSGFAGHAVWPAAHRKHRVMVTGPAPSLSEHPQGATHACPVQGTSTPKTWRCYRSSDLPRVTPPGYSCVALCCLHWSHI